MLLCFSMKWHVSKEEVMDFKFEKKSGGGGRCYLCILPDCAKRLRLSSEHQGGKELAALAG